MKPCILLEQRDAVVGLGGSSLTILPCSILTSCIQPHIPRAPQELWGGCSMDKGPSRVFLQALVA